MSTYSKYIVINMGGIKTPIVFPETAIHSDIADALGGRGRVLGAGFCTVDQDGYHCYGESVSLNVKSNYELDSNILNKALGVYIP